MVSSFLRLGAIAANQMERATEGSIALRVCREVYLIVVCISVYAPAASMSSW